MTWIAMSSRASAASTTAGAIALWRWVTARMPAGSVLAAV